MIRRPLLVLAALSIVLLVFYSQSYMSGGAYTLASAPQVMLWAWERPEHLSFLDGSKTGVAYLAETIYPKENGFFARPRLQPLELPANVYLEAVVRIETNRKIVWALSDKDMDYLAEAIAKVAAKPGVSALQIDFDARESERAFYRQLLGKVKALLPKRMPLTMTALSSWCLGDQWLHGLPVDEVVPMLFSMGAGEKESLDFITASDETQLEYFHKCVGLSVNDSRCSDVLANRVKLADSRIYFFSTRPWNSKLVQKAQDEVRSWKND